MDFCLAWALVLALALDERVYGREIGDGNGCMGEGGVKRGVWASKGGVVLVIHPTQCLL